MLKNIFTKNLYYFKYLLQNMANNLEDNLWKMQEET